MTDGEREPTAAACATGGNCSISGSAALEDDAAAVDEASAWTCSRSVSGRFLDDIAGISLRLCGVGGSAPSARMAWWDAKIQSEKQVHHAML